MSDTIARLNAALEGRYEIERELGEGGMAVVYLAKDLKHNRRVALKVLKPELAAVVGAERFLSEIETTANLQHPHILPLFDSGEAGSFLFYVMPYIEGETLRERIDREKQLPVDEAVRIAVAVANALHTAHEAGVVHRDIKPGNILMSRGEPLVADFGIALAVGAAGGSRLTETGLSVGTPYYMSPEQATGDQTVGPASDTYALAAVLYEMLVGDPPYVGSTAQAVLGKILQGDPVSATAVRKSIPANVDGAIRKALEKLPADRFTGAHEFARALTDAAFRHGGVAVAAAAAAQGRWRAAALAFAALAVVFGGVAVAAWSADEPPLPVSRYAVGLPDGHRPGTAGLGSNLALSPDGSLLVYVGAGVEGGAPQLWLRRRDQLEPTPIQGTNGALSPTFSPDGARVAFLVGNSVRAVSLGGAPPVTVADGGFNPGGLSWSVDGHIYGDPTGSDGLGRVPENGGEIELVSTPDSASSEFDHWWPQALPGGWGVLHTIAHMPFTDMTQYDVGVADTETGTHKVLVRGVMGRYAASGHLVYVSADGTLLAAPFDPEALELTGPSVALAEGVGVQAFGSVELALAGDGTLAYLTGMASTGLERVVWVTRDGRVTPVDPEWVYNPGRPEVHVELSPDGTRLALKIDTESGPDIWVKELDRGPLSRLTFDEGVDWRPRWSEDGRWIFFTSDRRGDYDLWRKPADGTGPPEPVLDLDRGIVEMQRTADEEWMVLRLGGLSGATGLRDLVALRAGDTVTVPVAAEPYDEKAAALSPDGRWLAYESNETGADEIYVRPFPNASEGKWQVSTGGGVNPRWSRSGAELFYINDDGEMTAAAIDTDVGFRVSRREVLFSVDDLALYYGENYAGWDVSPDGERFLMVQPADEGLLDPADLVVVENFDEELRERVPN